MIELSGKLRAAVAEEIDEVLEEWDFDGADVAVRDRLLFAILDLLDDAELSLG